MPLHAKDVILASLIKDERWNLISYFYVYRVEFHIFSHQCSCFLCHLNSLFTRARSLFEHSINNFRLSNTTLQVRLQTRKYIPGKIVRTNESASQTCLYRDISFAPHMKYTRLIVHSIFTWRSRSSVLKQTNVFESFIEHNPIQCPEEKLRIAFARKLGVNVSDFW